MPVGGVTGTSATSSSSATGSNGTKIGAAAGLGRDDFMKLLIAQLQNQDPMKPMEDKEFITQLAQFSSLEALEKLTEQMEELAGSQLLVQGAAMLGKHVTAKLADGTVVSGPVSQVRMISGQPKLIVNAQEIDPSLVTHIGS